MRNCSLSSFENTLPVRKVNAPFGARHLAISAVMRGDNDVSLFSFMENGNSIVTIIHPYFLALPATFDGLRLRRGDFVALLGQELELARL
jgi:hypothetical protein